MGEHVVRDETRPRGGAGRGGGWRREEQRWNESTPRRAARRRTAASPCVSACEWCSALRPSTSPHSMHVVTLLRRAFPFDFPFTPLDASVSAEASSSSSSLRANCFFLDVNARRDDVTEDGIDSAERLDQDLRRCVSDRFKKSRWVGSNNSSGEPFYGGGTACSSPASWSTKSTVSEPARHSESSNSHSARASSRRPESAARERDHVMDHR